MIKQVEFASPDSGNAHADDIIMWKADHGPWSAWPTTLYVASSKFIYLGINTGGIMLVVQVRLESCY